MAGYVFTPTYVGQDRRVGARTRFVDRRRLDADQLAPSLETALRQLTARAIELESARSEPGFMERLRATRHLAEKRHQPAVAETLSALIDTLANAPSHKSCLAESYLQQASSALMR